MHLSIVVMHDHDPDDALTEEQAAGILGLARVTLQQMRYRGAGPRWFRPSGRRVRYIRRDVLAYRDARVIGRKAAP